MEVDTAWADVLEAKDTMTRLQGLEGLCEELRKGQLPDAWAELIVPLGACLRDNNHKVCKIALECVGFLIGRLQGAIQPFAASMLPGVTECLGNGKAPVRQEAVAVLLAFSSPRVCGTVSMLDAIVSRFQQKNWRLREAVLEFVGRVATVDPGGWAARRQATIAGVLAPAFSDSSSEVRTQAAQTGRLLHSVLGDDLLQQLSEHGVRNMQWASAAAAAASDTASVTSGSSDAGAPTAAPTAVAAAPAPRSQPKAAPASRLARRAAAEAAAAAAGGTPQGATAAAAAAAQSYQPFAKLPPIQPVRVYTEGDVQREIDAVARGLQRADDWEAWVAALQRLAGVARGGAADSAALLAAFVAAVRASGVDAAVAKHVCDLRSAVQKEACRAAAAVVTALGAATAPLAEAWLPALLRNASNAKETISASAHCAAESILTATPEGFPKLLPQLLVGAAAKAAPVRHRSMGYLFLAVSTWAEGGVWERSLGPIADAVTVAVADKDVQFTRAAACRVYCALSRRYPALAARVMGAVDLRVQRRLREEEQASAAAAGSGERGQPAAVPLTATAPVRSTAARQSIMPGYGSGGFARRALQPAPAADQPLAPVPSPRQQGDTAPALAAALPAAAVRVVAAAAAADGGGGEDAEEARGDRRRAAQQADALLEAVRSDAWDKRASAWDGLRALLCEDAASAAALAAVPPPAAALGGGGAAASAAAAARPPPLLQSAARVRRLVQRLCDGVGDVHHRGAAAALGALAALAAMRAAAAALAPHVAELVPRALLRCGDAHEDVRAAAAQALECCGRAFKPDKLCMALCPHVGDAMPERARATLLEHVAALAPAARAYFWGGTGQQGRAFVQRSAALLAEMPKALDRKLLIEAVAAVYRTDAAAFVVAAQRLSPPLAAALRAALSSVVPELGAQAVAGRGAAQLPVPLLPPPVADVAPSSSDESGQQQHAATVTAAVVAAVDRPAPLQQRQRRVPPSQDLIPELLVKLGPSSTAQQKQTALKGLKVLIDDAGPAFWARHFAQVLTLLLEGCAPPPPPAAAAPPSRTPAAALDKENRHRAAAAPLSNADAAAAAAELKVTVLRCKYLRAIGALVARAPAQCCAAAAASAAGGALLPRLLSCGDDPCELVRAAAATVLRDLFAAMAPPPHALACLGRALPVGLGARLEVLRVVCALVPRLSAAQLREEMGGGGGSSGGGGGGGWLAPALLDALEAPSDAALRKMAVMAAVEMYQVLGAALLPLLPGVTAARLSVIAVYAEKRSAAGGRPVAPPLCAASAAACSGGGGGQVRGPCA
ncbi:armadillo-type protein [Tribonema minus]|uniref:Armadillo-type protein n=1 Tax=Tribonema minus TaxID=303371 RepID=A0A835ZF61_9STRA|nr:armadillo-type protein [Tribonema minus]